MNIFNIFNSNIQINGNNYGSDVKKGDGKITTSEVSDIKSFDKIASHGCADIYYHKSDEYKVTVTTDSNLIEYVDIHVSDTTLNVGLKNGSYSFTRLKVNVFCPYVNDVSIKGSGNFIGDNAFNVENFNASIKGSGDIVIYGSAKYARVQICGSGDFDGSDFKVKKASVHIKGSGDIDISVSDELDASVRGVGDIIYRGNPSIVSKVVKGLGKIKNKNNRKLN